MIARRIGRGSRAGKIVAADENGNVACILRKEHGLFRCGKAAADHEHLSAGEELTVAGRAVGNAAAAEVCFALKADHARVRTGGKQDAEALEFAAVGSDGLDLAGHIKALDAREQKFRAKALGLSTHRFGQLRAGSTRDAGVVHNFVGNGDLAAEFLLLDHDHAIFRSCKVQRRGEARRAAADDDNIIEILHNFPFLYKKSGTVDRRRFTVS